MEKTLVTFLLDRTGSMESCKEATIEAFNAYLKTLQAGPEAALIQFSFLQFDSMSVDKICIDEAVVNVKALDNDSYRPRASTPLIDASYKTIKAVEAALAKRDDKPKVVVCIQTDGMENASREYTMDQLNALIKEKSELGWQFNFMGASIDAYAQATQMGIYKAATVSYNKHSAVKTSSAFASLGANTRSYAAGMAATMDFHDAQKEAAGDEYFKPDPKPARATAGAPTKTVRPKATQGPASIVDDINL